MKTVEVILIYHVYIYIYIYIYIFTNIYNIFYNPRLFGDVKPVVPFVTEWKHNQDQPSLSAHFYGTSQFRYPHFCLGKTW